MSHTIAWGDRPGVILALGLGLGMGSGAAGIALAKRIAQYLLPVPSRETRYAAEHACPPGCQPAFETWRGVTRRLGCVRWTTDGERFEVCL